ncbi:hypothetical protein JCM11641_006054 [Rhodosporidiobolus odoratus]
MATSALSNSSERFRHALASSTPTSPPLSRLQRLADRLPSTSDIRNTEQHTRQTSLLIAAKRGRTDVAAWLLDEEHDEEQVSRDAAGMTVLHVAASFGFLDLCELYLSRYPFVVEWANARGQTPLHVAAMKGQDGIAQLFIDAGADINAPDLDGSTPLHYASSYGKLNVVKLLVDLDCQTDSINNAGFTAADFAYSFTLLKELEAVIRRRLEQVKEAKRAARQERKAKTAGQNLRAKRKGSTSALSIALPPTPSAPTTPDAFSSPTPDSAALPDSAPSSISGFGLGLSYPASPARSSPGMGTTSPLLLSMPVIPTLGSPIPPTPIPLSPEGDYAPPLAHHTGPVTPSEAPSAPRTPDSPYRNTTSQQPSPSTVASPSPLPSPTTGRGGTRSTTSDRSPLLLRRLSRAPSGSSPLSTPTSTGAPSILDVADASPASALSAETASTGGSSSAHTATPNPASPTPVSPCARRVSSSLHSSSLPSIPQGAAAPPSSSSQIQLQQPSPIPAIAAHQLRERSLSVASTASVSSSSGYLAPPLSTPPLSSAPSTASLPKPNAGGHKLIRKSRSHAHQPSLPSVDGSGGDSLALPFSPPMGVRSVSGPPGTGVQVQGRGSSESIRSTSLLGFGGEGGRLSGIWDWDGVGKNGNEKDKDKEGRKLRKERSSNSGFALGRGQSASEHSKARVGSGGGGRLARALGFGKKKVDG